MNMVHVALPVQLKTKLNTFYEYTRTAGLVLRNNYLVIYETLSSLHS